MDGLLESALLGKDNKTKLAASGTLLAVTDALAQVQTHKKATPFVLIEGPREGPTVECTFNLATLGSQTGRNSHIQLCVWTTFPHRIA